MGKHDHKKKAKRCHDKAKICEPCYVAPSVCLPSPPCYPLLPGFQGPNVLIATDTDPAFSPSGQLSLRGQTPTSSGLIVSGAGNALHIDNQRYVSQYVVDSNASTSSTGAVAKYSTVQAAYAQAVADNMGGVSGTPAVILIRPGTYTFTNAFPVTRGGISFKAVSTSGSSGAVIFAASAAGNGIAINTPNSHQSIQFEGITFGTPGDTTNTFVLSNTQCSSLTLLDCASAVSAFTYRLLSTASTFVTQFIDCKFAVSFSTATSFIDNQSAAGLSIFVTIRGSEFTQMSSGSTLATAMINASGSLTLTIDNSRFKSTNYSSMFSVGAGMAGANVSILASSFDGSTTTGSFLSCSGVPLFTVDNSVVTNFGNILLMNNVPTAATISKVAFNSSKCTSANASVTTNAAIVGALTIDVVGGSLKVLAATTNIFALATGTTGTVVINLPVTTLQFVNSGSTAYAAWGGSNANATINKGNVPLINGGVTPTATNFAVNAMTLL